MDSVSFACFCFDFMLKHTKFSHVSLRITCASCRNSRIWIWRTFQAKMVVVDSWYLKKCGTVFCYHFL